MWTARRILKELADADHRRRILAAFWKHSDATQRLLVQAQLARSLKFRDETIRKMSPEKKAELLAGRIGISEFDQPIEVALMQYHTHEKATMLAAFLDRWKVPHENGSIETDDYTPPTIDQVREAAKELAPEYGMQDVLVYLATAGLLMEGDWREATWPVVDEMSAQ